MAHVLIADDDQSIRETLRMLLEGEGHTVIEEATGRGALQALRDHSQRYVALIDLVMPDMDGFDVLRAVAEDAASVQRHAFVVLSAGSESLINAAEPLVAALQGFLIRKPFSIDDVTDVVNRAAAQLPDS